MKSTEGKIGRVFMLRFEDGDTLPDTIEKFAAESGITTAYVAFNGGLVNGEIVSGSEEPYARPYRPCRVEVKDPRTAAVTGLLVSDSDGVPRLRLCGALGYKGETMAGGLYSGLRTWISGEAVVYEIIGANFYRELDAETGRMELRAVAAPAHPAPAPADNPSFIHAGDHTHLLYVFNAEFN